MADSAGQCGRYVEDELAERAKSIGCSFGALGIGGAWSSSRRRRRMNEWKNAAELAMIEGGMDWGCFATVWVRTGGDLATVLMNCL
jgi:hypothetical protein